MQINNLYGFVLSLVLVAVVVGVGMIVLSNFGGTGGLSTGASTALNNSVTSLSAILNTWYPLIITVGVLGVVIALLLASFGGSGANR